MENAFRMTHPVIPQSNQFVSLEYLESLNIPQLSKITLADPVLEDSQPEVVVDNEYEITITENIWEFEDKEYVSDVNNLTVSVDIYITQTALEMNMDHLVNASCDNITKLNETYTTQNLVALAKIDEITCKATSSKIIIHVKAKPDNPILGVGNIRINRAEFKNKTAYRLTIGDTNFNITPLISNLQLH